jgi:GNAT superfamily N-acetyltransferase
MDAGGVIDATLGSAVDAVDQQIRAMIAQQCESHRQFASAYLKLPNGMTMYARVYVQGTGAMRYLRTEPQQVLSQMTGNAVVIANFEIDPRYQGHGFIKRLEEAISQIPGLQVLEYENVLNARLARSLTTHGFKQRSPDESTEGLYKLYGLELQDSEVTIPRGSLHDKR